MLAVAENHHSTGTRHGGDATGFTEDLPIFFITGSAKFLESSSPDENLATITIIDEILGVVKVMRPASLPITSQ